MSSRDDDPRGRVVHVLALAHRGADLLGREPAVEAGQAARDEAGVDGRAAELVDQDVRVLLGEQLLAGPREDPQRDLVRHRRGGDEDRLLLAEQRGAAALELEHRRVLALLLVADDRLGDRAAHLGRGLGERVCAEVDHGSNATVAAWTLRSSTRRSPPGASPPTAPPRCGSGPRAASRATTR